MPTVREQWMHDTRLQAFANGGMLLPAWPEEVLSDFWTYNKLHQRWPNFHPHEIACRHCQQIRLNWDAMDALQRLRDAAKVPIHLTSAYRCAEHNAAVGGSPNSYHMAGRAFDITTFNTRRGMLRLTKLATLAGFRGFGYYDGFTHVDTGPSREWFEANDW